MYVCQRVTGSHPSVQNSGKTKAMDAMNECKLGAPGMLLVAVPSVQLKLWPSERHVERRCVHSLSNDNQPKTAVGRLTPC
jgi:hypothetical protein